MDQRISLRQPRWQAVILALALAFGVAMLLNWGVLWLFGQKSAERAEHSLVGIILLMTCVWGLRERQGSRWGPPSFFALTLIPCYLGTVFPDLDITLLSFGAHRNPLFHSCLSFLVLWWWVRRRNVVLQSLVLGYGIGLGSHLWWDVVYYGNVHWIPGGTLDRLWLGANGLVCLLPLMGQDRGPA